MIVRAESEKAISLPFDSQDIPSGGIQMPCKKSSFPGAAMLEMPQPEKHSQLLASSTRPVRAPSLTSSPSGCNCVRQDKIRTAQMCLPDL